MRNFCLSNEILQRFQSVENELGKTEHIVKLDCSMLDTWEFRDRKPFELGSIDSLALSIQHSGQCQPIIVVKASNLFKPKDNPRAQYVVIAGYRRWMACKKYNIPVQAIVRNISFEQAITVLVSENEKENVSDYSKGLFYHSLLSSEKITKEDLIRQLNISVTLLESYLSFVHVPQEIWNAIGDLSRISFKTAAKIRSIAEKGTMYVDALKLIAKKIEHGFGEKRIQEAVDSIIDKKMKRTPFVKPIAHKLKLNGKVIMNSQQGRIKLDSALATHEKYYELIAKIEKDVLDFANFYMKDK